MNIDKVVNEVLKNKYVMGKDIVHTVYGKKYREDYRQGLNVGRSYRDMDSKINDLNIISTKNNYKIVQDISQVFEGVKNEMYDGILGGVKNIKSINCVHTKNKYNEIHSEVLFKDGSYNSKITFTDNGFFIHGKYKIKDKRLEVKLGKNAKGYSDVGLKIYKGNQIIKEKTIYQYQFSEYNIKERFNYFNEMLYKKIENKETKKETKVENKEQTKKENKQEKKYKKETKPEKIIQVKPDNFTTGSDHLDAGIGSSLAALFILGIVYIRSKF